MWHVDIPTRDELVLFAEFSEPGLVTILLPTTPVTAQVQADRIQLKNLGAEALARLTELGVRSAAEVAEVAEEIADLVDDDTFWAHQSHGLAVIVVPDHVWTLRLPVTVGPSIHVGDRVPLMPLLAAASRPRECFVLALSEGGARLIDVPADLPPLAVRVPDLPAGAAAAAGKASIGDRSHSGRLVGSEGKRTHLRHYARAVDAALRPVIAGSELPLVLAATEPIRSIYRGANSYPHLLEEALETNPDRSSDQELAIAAREILDRDLGARLDTYAELVERRRSQSRVASDLADVARFAARGAVDTLLVANGHHVAGSVDADTGALTLSSDGDAIDDLCRLVLLTAGTVLVVEPDAVPDGGPLVAVLRFAP
jgi:hypothetical protein